MDALTKFKQMDTDLSDMHKIDNELQTIFDLATDVIAKLQYVRLALHRLEYSNVNRAELKKGSRTLKKTISNLENLGGDYRGGCDMSLKEKREGGDVRGVLLKKFSHNSLGYYSDDDKALLTKLYAIMQNKLSTQQMAFINDVKQKVYALKTICKLKKLGYDDTAITQAVYNAFNDGFWCEHFMHVKALSNTSKNGSLVIDNLLKINKHNTKINTPKNIVF
jgi:hypothetical protein